MVLRNRFFTFPLDAGDESPASESEASSDTVKAVAQGQLGIAGQLPANIHLIGITDVNSRKGNKVERRPPLRLDIPPTHVQINRPWGAAVVLNSKHSGDGGE